MSSQAIPADARGLLAAFPELSVFACEIEAGHALATRSRAALLGELAERAPLGGCAGGLVLDADTDALHALGIAVDGDDWHTSGSVNSGLGDDEMASLGELLGEETLDGLWSRHAWFRGLVNAPLLRALLRAHGDERALSGRLCRWLASWLDDCGPLAVRLEGETASWRLATEPVNPDARGAEFILSASRAGFRDRSTLALLTAPFEPGPGLDTLLPWQLCQVSRARLHRALGERVEVAVLVDTRTGSHRPVVRWPHAPAAREEARLSELELAYESVLDAAPGESLGFDGASGGGRRREWRVGTPWGEERVTLEVVGEAIVLASCAEDVRRLPPVAAARPGARAVVRRACVAELVARIAPSHPGLTRHWALLDALLSAEEEALCLELVPGSSP